MPRHRHIPLLRLLLISALLLVTGCGDDPAEPSPSGNDTAGTLQAEFSAAEGSFEFDTNPSGDPSRPVTGPFRIRGSNVHYDDGLGALVVDLTIENRSRQHLPYPVMLTFLGLFPEGVQVLNADNDETGPGAQIHFPFAEDDLTWDPGEVSLPRTVQFATDPGTAIGFVARVDVGLDPSFGAIGGVVYHDRNENQMMDTDEEGIGGAVIVLAGPDDLERRTRSVRDGSYRFENLPAGAYTLRKLAMDGSRPTTPPELVVILPETDDGVGDYLHANFGCLRMQPPPVDAVLRPGDILRVKGRYQSDPHRIVAAAIAVHRPGPDEFPLVHATLAGPVTDLAPERDAVAIAGTWVRVDEPDDDPAVGQDGCALEDLEPRDRVVARDIHWMRVPSNDRDVLVTRQLDCWDREVDFVEGVADVVENGGDAAGRILARVQVLNTWIVVTAETEITRDQPPVEPYPPLTTPDEVVKTLMRSYEERNLPAFDRMLGGDFAFHFAPGDVSDGAPQQWDRAREMGATGRMFSGEPSMTPGGIPGAPVHSIDVALRPASSEGWIEAGDGAPEGALVRHFMAELTVRTVDGGVVLITGLQEFVVVGEARDRVTLYHLTTWRDLGQPMLNTAVEHPTWGAFKLGFGN